MFRRWFKRQLEGDRTRELLIAPSLPEIAVDEVRQFIVEDEGVPHINWAAAAAWIDMHAEDPEAHPVFQRAIAATWLDEIHDMVAYETMRWRSALVEGLAPTRDSAASRLEVWSLRALHDITTSLDPIHNGALPGPVIIFATRSSDAYYSFIAHFYDEGVHGGSGGIYLGADHNAFPMLVIDGSVTWGIEAVVVHELTHHALAGCRLPLWAEEGLTQMMEERIAGGRPFIMNSEMMDRHRALWSDIGFGPFTSGIAFGSSERDQQELAYHLALAMTRSLLERRASDFFAFARACRDNTHEDAAREHLGRPAAEIAAAFLDL